MDEIVSRSMLKWPDVPAVYGWLSLDRRGNWMIKTVAGRFERIANAAVREFIGRNYAADAEGRWYFQNGPQRVFVALDAHHEHAPAAADAKRTTHVDGPIRSRELELMHRLDGESRGETSFLRQRLSLSDHVRRDVGTVDIEAVTEQRHQDPPGSASNVECRLPEPADCRPEVGELLGLGHVELRPPTSHQPVMPGPGLRHQGPLSS